MDACEIANFLASELFMHQVKINICLVIKFLFPNMTVCLKNYFNKYSLEAPINQFVYNNVSFCLIYSS